MHLENTVWKYGDIIYFSNIKKYEREQTKTNNKVTFSPRFCMCSFIISAIYSVQKPTWLNDP